MKRNEKQGSAISVACGGAGVRVSDKGETFFTEAPTGFVRYHLPRDEAWNAEMLEKIRNFNKIK